MQLIRIYSLLNVVGNKEKSLQMFETDQKLPSNSSYSKSIVQKYSRKNEIIYKYGWCKDAFICPCIYRFYI